MTQPVLCAATRRITIGVNALYGLIAQPSPPLRAQQRYLDVVKAWLTNETTNWVDDNTLCQALSMLLGLDAEQTREHLGAFVGPMLVWSTSQPWEQDVQQARAFSALCNLHFARHAKTQPYDTCLAALNSILLWLPKLPLDVQQDIVAHAIQDINNKIEWGLLRISDPTKRQDEWLIASKMARLTAYHPRLLCDEKDTASDLWLRAMNEYATCSLDINEQLAWAKSLMACREMPDNCKRHLLASLVPEIWLNPQVQLDHLLPLDEQERFFWMPWAISRSPTWTRVLSDQLPEVTNQAMLRKFCPEAERIIGSVARPNDWKDHRIIADLMRGMRDAQRADGVLPLPTDLL